jgi:hypothetical protein
MLARSCSISVGDAGRPVIILCVARTPSNEGWTRKRRSDRSGSVGRASAAMARAFDDENPRQRPNDHPFAFIKRNCRCTSSMTARRSKEPSGRIKRRIRFDLWQILGDVTFERRQHDGLGRRILVDDHLGQSRLQIVWNVDGHARHANVERRLGRCVVLGREVSKGLAQRWRISVKA